MVDLTELEEYAKLLPHYQLEGLIIDSIFGELGGCLKNLDTQEKAERAIGGIYGSIYYYLYAVNNKATKKVKDKVQEREKALKKKTSDFIELLDTFVEGSKPNQLRTLLEDMEENPWQYAKIPDFYPEVDLQTKEYVKDRILLALNRRLDERNCLNAIKRLITKLPN